MIFDFDQHLFEYPRMWVDHIAPEERDLALTVERDELGFPWVFSRATNQRIYIYAKTVPEDGFASHVTPGSAGRTTSRRRRTTSPMSRRISSTRARG